MTPSSSTFAFQCSITAKVYPFMEQKIQLANQDPSLIFDENNFDDSDINPTFSHELACFAATLEMENYFMMNKKSSDLYATTTHAEGHEEEGPFHSDIVSRLSIQHEESVEDSYYGSHRNDDHVSFACDQTPKESLNFSYLNISPLSSCTIHSPAAAFYYLPSFLHQEQQHPMAV